MRCSILFAAEGFDAEHPLFILYTSGSTGKPKGILHTTGGYLTGTSTTFHYIFDHQPGDVYWCTADVGWITGHSYIVYGPMACGATQVMYEGAPNSPDWSRLARRLKRSSMTPAMNSSSSMYFEMQKPDFFS